MTEQSVEKDQIEQGTRTDVVRHKVGVCPACRDYLWADVEVLSKVSAPSLSTEGQALVYASAKPVSMVVSHSCVIPEEDR
jgi:hypothetical protein